MINKEFNPSITYPDYFGRRRLLQSVSKYADQLHGKILDFGCGSRPYQSLFENAKEYVGLDYMGEGHNHDHECIDVFYDGTYIPFADETFDSVFTSQVFEHVVNIEEIIPEIKRVMKLGALILLVCPFSYAEHETPADYTRFTSFGIKNLMEKNGFEVIAQDKLGNSFETIAHLWTSYVTIHIIPHLKKIPFLGGCFQALHSVVFNSIAIVFGKILPSGKELFLDNVLVCRKINK